LLLLMGVSCAQEPQATTVSPTPTEVMTALTTAAPTSGTEIDSTETAGPPTPTKAVPKSPTAAPPDGSGFNSPDPQSLPEVPAPLGVADIDLPDDAESITALFNSLPPRLIGNERTIQSTGDRPGEVLASYGNTQPVGCGTNGLQAMDVSTGDFFPQGWTAERVVAVFAVGTDWEVEDFGRDGELFWVRWNTTCSTENIPGTDTVFTASWGAAGSPWFFSASAGGSGGRDAFMAAFVDASK
jgi:hypothetical protein